MRQDGRGEWAVLARVIARGSGGSPCLDSFTLKSLATRLASKQQPLDRMGGCSPFSVTTVSSKAKGADDQEMGAHDDDPKDKANPKEIPETEVPEKSHCHNWVSGQRSCLARLIA